MTYHDAAEVNNAGDVQPMKAVSDMTDREIAVETLTWLRTFGAAMQQLQSGGMAGMLKGMMGMGRR